MSDNPLETTPAREQRIRERAYHLWHADGEPGGHDLEYWERARELIGMEESVGSGQLPNPENSNDPLPGVIVDEAFLQENLGEFPDRSADQGERTATPMTKPQQSRSRKAAAS